MLFISVYFGLEHPFHALMIICGVTAVLYGVICKKKKKQYASRSSRLSWQAIPPLADLPKTAHLALSSWPITPRLQSVM